MIHVLSEGTKIQCLGVGKKPVNPGDQKELSSRLYPLAKFMIPAVDLNLYLSWILIFLGSTTFGHICVSDYQKTLAPSHSGFKNIMLIKLTKQECVGNALPGKTRSLGEPDCVDLMIRIWTPRVSASTGNPSCWRVRSAPVRTVATSIGSKGHTWYIQAKGITRLPSHQRVSWTLKGSKGGGVLRG